MDLHRWFQVCAFAGYEVVVTGERGGVAHHVVPSLARVHQIVLEKNHHRPGATKLRYNQRSTDKKSPKRRCLSSASRRVNQTVKTLS